jgi:hypothetical protein
MKGVKVGCVENVSVEGRSLQSFCNENMYCINISISKTKIKEYSSDFAAAKKTK